MHVTSDGRRLDVSLTVSPVKDPEGNVVGASTIARDMTECKLAEMELTREREFLNATLNNLKDGIVVCDAEGVLTFFNRTTREFHGVEAEESTADEWAGRYDLYYPDGRTPMRKEDVPLYRAYNGENVRDAEMVIATTASRRI